MTGFLKNDSFYSATHPRVNVAFFQTNTISFWIAYFPHTLIRNHVKATVRDANDIQIWNIQYGNLVVKEAIL